MDVPIAKESNNRLFLSRRLTDQLKHLDLGNVAHDSLDHERQDGIDDAWMEASEQAAWDEICGQKSLETAWVLGKDGSHTDSNVAESLNRRPRPNLSCIKRQERHKRAVLRPSASTEAFAHGATSEASQAARQSAQVNEVEVARFARERRVEFRDSLKNTALEHKRADRKHDQVRHHPGHPELNGSGGKHSYPSNNNPEQYEYNRTQLRSTRHAKHNESGKVHGRHQDDSRGIEYGFHYTVSRSPHNSPLSSRMDGTRIPTRFRSAAPVFLSDTRFMQTMRDNQDHHQLSSRHSGYHHKRDRVTVASIPWSSDQDEGFNNKVYPVYDKYRRP